MVHAVLCTAHAHGVYGLRMTVVCHHSSQNNVLCKYWIYKQTIKVLLLHCPNKGKVITTF